MTPSAGKVVTNCLARLERGSELALIGSTCGGRLGLIAGSGTLELLTNLLDAGSAGGAVNCSSVAEVGVDANKELTTGCLDVLDHYVTLGALLAVTARAVQLAKVGDLEAVDGDGASAVVLDDLVFGTSGASASDGGIAILLESQSIYVIMSICRISRSICGQLTLADFSPPDVLECAGTLTVNALDLICIISV